MKFYSQPRTEEVRLGVIISLMNDFVNSGNHEKNEGDSEAPTGFAPRRL